MDIDFTTHIETARTFLTNNLWLTVIIAIVLLILAYNSAKKAIRTVFCIGFVTVIGVVILPYVKPYIIEFFEYFKNKLI